MSKSRPNYFAGFGSLVWLLVVGLPLYVMLIDPDKLKPTLQYMPDALGRALESATLGYPAGSPDGTVVRDADNAAVMQSVMEKYGNDAGLLKQHESMADSLGTMGAGYIDDINWALDKGNPDSVFAPGKNPDGHIDFADDEEGRSTARGFLSVLGQHPDSYATIDHPLHHNRLGIRSQP